MDVIENPEVNAVIMEKLCGVDKLCNILIISAEVNGNDLVVNYIYYTSFKNANLENANFKNAGLWHANFHSANLTNADLTNADLTNAGLRKALLNNANLSNANLQGADLSGANLSNVIYDQNTILKCVNHDICV